MKRKALLFNILNSLSLLVMLVVNYLANSLSLNGITTGEVSKLYDNLFVPASFSFAIWGVLYLSQLLFIGYGIYHNVRGQAQKLTGQRLIGAWYALSSLLNIAWLISWHYQLLALSSGIMLLLLFSLIQIYRNLGIGIRKVSHGERFFMHLPFSLYLAWISVASIANITALLVGYGFHGFGLPPEFYATAMVLIASLLGIWFLNYNVDLFFALVIAWALFGILYRHYWVLENHYPVVATAAGAGIFLLALRYLKLRKIAAKTRAYW